MAGQSDTQGDMQGRLIAKAWEDETFKRSLLEDPKSTIEKELEVTLPADLKIQVVEETRDTICLVLPVDPNTLPEAELSEDELEAVAGGAYTPTRVSLASKLGGFGRLNTLTYTIPGVRRQ
jgi:hypothetical protein